MILLLDTRVLMWALQDAPELGVDARLKLRAADAIYVSAASIWEAKMKAETGKVLLPNGLLGAIASSGFQELAVGWEAAEAIDEVEASGLDGFDRLLITQARQEQLLLLTADQRLLQAYPSVCFDAQK